MLCAEFERNLLDNRRLNAHFVEPHNDQRSVMQSIMTWTI